MPLSATDDQLDLPLKSCEPLSSENTVSSNGSENASDAAGLSRSRAERPVERVGDDFFHQKTATSHANATALAAANEAEVGKLREVEALRISQDGMHQQIESLKQSLLAVTAAKATNQGDNLQNVRTPPMINGRGSNSNTMTHHSRKTTMTHHSRKTNKRWRHSIRVFALSFLALTWFHLHLLTTSNLPTLVANLEEDGSLRGASGGSVSGKVKSLEEQLRRLEGEKAKKLAARDSRTALCCVAREEEPYIDEWVDYHLGLGFGKIIVYDNSEAGDLKIWGQNRGEAIQVVHFPGTSKQQVSYWDCARKANEGKYGRTEWVGFWDIDEFLVLKKHDDVGDFVREYVTTGALGINWYLFGPSGRISYQPLPVTKRFACRQNKPNPRVKSLVRLKDMNMEIAPHVHFPYLNEGNMKDTNGRIFEGPFNEDGPIDTAVLHHYRTKSVKEFLQKTIRGRADVDDQSSLQKRKYKGRVKNAKDIFEKVLAHGGEKVGAETCHTMTYDDSAWSAMKKHLPKYALYDALASGAQSVLPDNLENVLLDLEF